MSNIEAAILEEAIGASREALLLVNLDQSEWPVVLANAAFGEVGGADARGRPVADGAIETLLLHPGHAAAVRALGLGELIPGVVTARGEAETAFGKVRTTPGTGPGPALILVRPDQPRLAADDTGVEAEVVSLGLRPPEGREVRRVAVVRAAGNILRVLARGRTLSVGERVRVRIDGECDPVQGQ